MTGWPIYRGSGEPHDGIKDLPPPPNWRAFSGGPPIQIGDVDDAGEGANITRRLGHQNERIPSTLELQMINAALFLRRPLLVTGDPGV